MSPAVTDTQRGEYIVLVDQRWRACGCRSSSLIKFQLVDDESP